MRQSGWICLIAIQAGLWCVSGSCLAVDQSQGRALHDEDCLVCHDSSVYTRETRRMQSLQELTARVDMCRQDVGAEWNEGELDAVVSYLNSAFYKFEKAAPAAP